MKLDAHRRNVVVIGTSAGGVEALSALLDALPADLPAAVLAVLHIPAHTESVLHSVLAKRTALKVVAANSQALEAGTVYIAPTDRHLMLDAHGIRLTRGPKECRVRPSIDVLFRSAAVHHGARTIGVVLTGALDDGTAGLWAVKDAGGLALVQDPADALMPSMPESALSHVQVDFVGDVLALAAEIVRQVDAPFEQPEPSPHHDRHRREDTIVASGKGLENGVMSLGRISNYTCPDCHGVLVQIEEGSIVRFRCHTGHAFSIKSLIAEVNSAIDNGLWDTLRAVEERIVLLRQMADLSARAGWTAAAADSRRQADEAERRLRPLRELVLDPHFFGHDQAK